MLRYFGGIGIAFSYYVDRQFVLRFFENRAHGND